MKFIEKLLSLRDKASGKTETPVSTKSKNSVVAVAVVTVLSLAILTRTYYEK